MALENGKWVSRPNDQIYQSAGKSKWTVWMLAHSIGVYNQNGVRVATVNGASKRDAEMAITIADAFAAKWEW